MKIAFAAASLAAFLAAPLTAGAAFAEPAEYEFDKSHTTIKATWNHLGLSNQSIHFTDYDGVLLLDLEEPSNSTVDVTFNLADGFWVGADQGDFEQHLNSGDLFNTGEYPTAQFTATEFQTEDGETGTMTGDLTILGQTRPVTLDVTMNHNGPHPMGGGQALGFSATGTLDRTEWGLDYAAPNVSSEVRITIETELALAEGDADE